MNYFFSLLFTVTASLSTAYAQSIENPFWKTRSDYKSAEGTVLKYLKELEQEPEKDLPAREKSNYVLRWIMGCPYVSIKMKGSYFAKIFNDPDYKYREHLAFGLLFGEVLYFLENPYDRNRKNAHRYSIHYTMSMYENLKGFDASSSCQIMELFIRLDEQGSLEALFKLEQETN